MKNKLCIYHNWYKILNSIKKSYNLIQHFNFLILKLYYNTGNCIIFFSFFIFNIFDIKRNNCDSIMNEINN